MSKKQLEWWMELMVDGIDGGWSGWSGWSGWCGWWMLDSGWWIRSRCSLGWWIVEK